MRVIEGSGDCEMWKVEKTEDCKLDKREEKKNFYIENNVSKKKWVEGKEVLWYRSKWKYD